MLLNFTKIILSISVLTVIPVITVSEAQALDPVSGTLTVGAGLGVLQEEVFDNIDDSVDNFFDRFDNSAIKLRSLADGLLSNARSDMEFMLDKTIDELEGQERQLWLYYQGMLNDLDRRVEGYLKDGTVTMLHVGNIVDELIPFSSKDPAIFWIEAEPPLYVSNVENRVITAYGLNLGHPKNTLTSNNSEIVRSSLSKTKLSFTIKDSNTEDGIDLGYSLWKQRVLWDKKISQPPITLPPVQDYLGDLRLVYTEEVDVFENRVWPASGNPKRVQCQNPTNPTSSRCRARSRDLINALNGYSIEPDSIKFTKIRDKGSDCDPNSKTISGVNLNSFRFSYQIRPDHGSRRHCWGEFALKWTEKKDMPNKERRFSEIKPLKRSTRGASFEYPISRTSPIALQFTPLNEEEMQTLSLTSLRWPIETRVEAGAGVVEVNWRE